VETQESVKKPLAVCAKHRSTDIRQQA